jgi:hypothetical protein
MHTLQSDDYVNLSIITIAIPATAPVQDAEGFLSFNGARSVTNDRFILVSGDRDAKVEVSINASNTHRGTAFGEHPRIAVMRRTGDACAEGIDGGKHEDSALVSRQPPRARIK